MDEIHLKRLLQENILRVEKENWDFINKEIQEEQDKKWEGSLKENQNLVVIGSSRMSKNASVNRKVKCLNSTAKKTTDPSSPSNKSTDPKIPPEEMQSAHCDGHFTMHRHIEFLNHFQSELQKQQWQLRNKHSMHAIPLSPPLQRNLHFSVEKRSNLYREESNKENNQLYTFSHNETPRKLSIQKLPSITIYNKNTKANSNVLLEEIKVLDEDVRDDYKIKALPEDATRRLPPFSVSRNSSEPFVSDRNINQSSHHPESSLLMENVISSEATIDRNVLQALVKEILKGSQNFSNFKLLPESREDEGLSTIKSSQTAHSGLFRKEEQKCNCHAYQRKSLHTQTEDAEICSNFCQTDSTETSPDKVKVDRLFLRNLIQEVILEHPSFSTIIQYGDSRETSSHVNSQKVGKSVQDNISIVEGSRDKLYLSKETKVPVLEESNPFSNSTKCDASGCVNEDKLENKSSSFNIEQQLATLTSKVENLKNVFNSHAIKGHELFSENISQNKSSEQKPIYARDVSLQFSPYLINRSSCTSPVRTLDKGNQCDNCLMHTKQPSSDVSTQANSHVPEPLAKESKTVSTQADYTAFLTKNVWVQTERANADVIEHSNSSSVAVTPVSDSPFLDDVLSEGEIPLHLKFLSYHGQAVSSNSTVVESSEEKEYSLSEGEIHPHYLQTLSASPSLVDNQSKKAALCASCASLKQTKLHTKKNWSASSGEINSFYQDQISSSTPLPHYRNSPGEILAQSSSASKRPSFHASNPIASEHDSSNYINVVT